MQRVPLPVETVALIRAIVNQDLRERRAAGFKLGTYGLARRIAAELGLTYRTVRKIKERERRKDVRACHLIAEGTTLPKERLEEIRQRRIRSGEISASWKPIRPDQCHMHRSYRKRLSDRR